MGEHKRQVYVFDHFRLDAGERQLWRAGQPVALPSKAFDLLLALVENRGRLLEKDELYHKVWPDQIVEESNLTVQMSAIRKALGERRQKPRYIVTVAGHGYRFVGDVLLLDEEREVVIETETRSRIVIEKEVEDDNDSNQIAALVLPADHNTSQIVEVENPFAPQASRKGLVQRNAFPGGENDSPTADVTGEAMPETHGLIIEPTPSRQRTLISRLWQLTESSAGRIALMLATVGLALLIYFLWFKQTTAPTQLTSTNRITSIAVLPFKPLVADSRDESLEMGMADTLIARLSNIREINVRPISAVRKYAGLEQDALAAGKEQKVDAVVDGQIQKSGNKIRVTVRMMRVEDGVPFWTTQFDEKMTDIFTVQDSISQRISGVLAAKLSGEERERLTKSYTENTEAYNLYLLGRYHLNRLTDDGFLKSLDYFQQAIEKDPNFALAYTGVADSYNALGGFNVRPPKEVYPKAKSAAVTALNLDPLLAQAHTDLAMVNLTFDWDWPGAEKEFKRAIEINPSDSDAHFNYSYYFAFMGQFDNAIAESRKAQELDPVSLVKLTGVAQILLMGRRYDEAIEECRKALDMDPNLGFAHWLLGLAYMYKGSYEPAILALQKSIPLSADSPDEPASLAHAYALSGKRAEARKILEELKQQAKRKYISPGTMADLYSALGEKDEAFALLDKAYEERDNMVVLLKVEPMYDPLRSDPRFANLLRRVGFPQ